MVMMNDVIAFIERAIKEDLNIEVEYCDHTGYKYYVVQISDNNRKCFRIECIIKDNKITFELHQPRLNSVVMEISEMELALFKVEVLKAREYSKNKTIEAFNNFFEKDSSKPTTINDLDNEDD